MKCKQVSNEISEVLYGVDAVYNAVASTLGPYGATVVIENDHRSDMAPVVTKDGVTVASSLNFSYPLKQLGAKLILQASSQADVKSGDGTTTTVVLAKALIDAAIDAKAKGRLPVQIRKDLEVFSDTVVAALEDVAQNYTVDDEMLHNIAMVSSNGERIIAKIALTAVNSAAGGPVTIRSYRGESDAMEVLEGSIISGTPLTIDQLPRDGDLTIMHPRICLINGRLVHELFEGISKIAESTGEGKLIILCNDISDGLDQKVAAFNQRTSDDRTIIVLRTPGIGKNRQLYLSILEQMTGARVVEPGQQQMTIGTATAIAIGNVRSSLVPAMSFNQQECANGLIAKRNGYPVGTINYKHLDEVLRFVVGRRVSVQVGGLTEANTKERYDRVVDAVNAVEVAKSGVIPGGGTTLAKIAIEKRDMPNSYMECLWAPLLKIISNGTGKPADEHKEHITNLWHNAAPADHTYFYDVINGQYIDVIGGGSTVYDPLVVVKNAVRAAATVAATIVSTDYYIYNE